MARVIWGGWFPFSKEYITGKIAAPLNPGKKYCLSFYLNLSDNSGVAIDRIGIYFSNDSIFYNTFHTLPVTPQLETPTGQFFADTANWMLVSFEYVAQGGERYLTFGNFHNDTTTNVYKLDSTASYSYAYYFIDDVSLICCDADSCILNLPAVIPNVLHLIMMAQTMFLK